MKISEIIMDKYKLRIPPTIYYELLADVVEAEDEQEPILDKIRAEIEAEKLEDSPNFCVKAHNNAVDRVLGILDKYKAETEET